MKVSNLTVAGVALWAIVLTPSVARADVTAINGLALARAMDASDERSGVPQTAYATWETPFTVFQARASTGFISTSIDLSVTVGDPLGPENWGTLESVANASFFAEQTTPWTLSFLISHDLADPSGGGQMWTAIEVYDTERGQSYSFTTGSWGWEDFAPLAFDAGSYSISMSSWAMLDTAGGTGGAGASLHLATVLGIQPQQAVVPAPGAALLILIGIGLVNWLKRRVG